MPKSLIVSTFAEWTAFSATRSGWTLCKKREAVYPLIQTPDYEALLALPTITPTDFDQWHQTSVEQICDKAPGLPVGWAAKIINVYLKTRVYLAGEGSPDLIGCIHPPIDGGLWQGIKAAYGTTSEIYQKTHCVNRIKDIQDYSTYSTIIEGCKLIAEREGWQLIEVEYLWQGTKG